MLKWSGQIEYIKSLEQVKNGENEQAAQSCCPQIPAQLTTDSTRGGDPHCPRRRPPALSSAYLPTRGKTYGGGHNTLRFLFININTGAGENGKNRPGIEKKQRKEQAEKTPLPRNLPRMSFRR